MKKRTILSLLLVCSLQFMQAQNGKEISTISIVPEHIIRDVSSHPIGMNLNFFMDGGRYPNARHSVKEAMQEMGMKYLRYPGGEKSDLHLFDLDNNGKPVIKFARKGPKLTQDYQEVLINSEKLKYPPLDFDEYIKMCRQIGAEPVVVVAADRYLHDTDSENTVTSKEELIKHAVKWVKYANITKGYHIRYWMIGNESWNDNNTHSTAEIYAHDVVDFSRAMKAVDPSILIIPNTHKEPFTRTLIEIAGKHFDRIAVSNYPVYQYYAGYNSYRDSVQWLAGPTTSVLTTIRKYATPEQQKQWKIIVAEYGAIDWSQSWPDINDMGHAIVTFDMTGELLKMPEVDHACFWNTRWLRNSIPPLADHDALNDNGEITPVGRSVMIWGKYMLDNLVELQSCPQVKGYATLSSDKQKIRLFLANKFPDPITVNFKIGDKEKIGAIKQLATLYGKSPEDRNPQWSEKMQIHSDIVLLAGNSITVLEMETTK